MRPENKFATLNEDPWRCVALRDEFRRIFLLKQWCVAAAADRTLRKNYPNNELWTAAEYEYLIMFQYGELLNQL